MLRDPISALTHFAGMLIAIPAAAFLVRLCRGDRVKFIGMLIYGVTLVLCYAGSALFHTVPEEYEETFSKFDHIGIYLLIAGTATPIGLIVGRGWVRRVLVGGLWIMAATGIILRLFCEPSLMVRTIFYVVMGWIGCSLYFHLVKRLSHAKVVPVWIGGLFYTAGAAINLWVDFPPWFSAHVFTPHDLFHVLVMCGSAAHYYFMLAVLVPYRRKPAFAEALALPAPALPPLVPVPVPVLSNNRARPGASGNVESR
jgi:hemolysin III